MTIFHSGAVTATMSWKSGGMQTINHALVTAFGGIFVDTGDRTLGATTARVGR